MADQGYVTDEARLIDPVILEDGQTVFLTRVDPYGHIYLSLSQGTLPEKYQGGYTTVEFAHRDVNKYAQERKLALAEITSKKRKNVKTESLLSTE